MTSVPKNSLEVTRCFHPDTLEDEELQLESMVAIVKTMPIPVLIYTKSGKIKWCNKAMLHLFWGTLETPTYRDPTTVFDKYVKDVMPDYLWPYVLEQNNKVFETKMPQYENWSDEVWNSIRWKCMRWYINRNHVAVVLFPEDESHLAICAEALRVHKE